MNTQTKEPVQDAEILGTPVNQPLTETRNPQPLMSLASQLPRLPELAKALVAAQASCPAVEKTGWNKHHEYHYATSNDIIAAAKKALNENGLALMPSGARLDNFKTGNEIRWELNRQFLLLHTSGETAIIPIVWPVIPGAGRPLDKANGASDTLSLTYLLRDLLLMPAVDPADDVPGREDAEQPQTKQAPTQPASPKAANNGTAPATPYGQDLIDEAKVKEIWERIPEQERQPYFAGIMQAFGVKGLRPIGKRWQPLLEALVSKKTDPKFFREKICDGKRFCDLDDLKRTAVHTAVLEGAVKSI